MSWDERRSNEENVYDKLLRIIPLMEAKGFSNEVKLAEIYWMLDLSGSHDPRVHHIVEEAALEIVRCNPRLLEQAYRIAKERMGREQIRERRHTLSAMDERTSFDLSRKPKRY